MSRLTIDLPPAPATSAHPSREVARDALLRFLGETAHAYRVTEAGWMHTSYDIVEDADGQTVLGRAHIDEVCACGHIHDEHDDIACTVMIFVHGRLTDCACRSYEPVAGDPTLFELDTCTMAGPPRPT
ncbi:MAG TPA: hypothetical protein VE666_13070 [Mycobacterium sp.]|nr:hypothetical protein [Mycobacterium sp.]